MLRRENAKKQWVWFKSTKAWKLTKQLKSNMKCFVKGSAQSLLWNTVRVLLVCSERWVGIDFQREKKNSNYCLIFINTSGLNFRFLDSHLQIQLLRLNRLSHIKLSQVVFFFPLPSFNLWVVKTIVTWEAYSIACAVKSVKAQLMPHLKTAFTLEIYSCKK